MDIEEPNLREGTPPKRVTIQAPSTPPPKENPETMLKLMKSLAKSNGKQTAPFKTSGFLGGTPGSRKSKGRTSKDSDDEDEEPSRLDQDYEFICSLGKGNFSSVGLYMSKVQGQRFAIKKNKTSSMSVNEIQALATLSIVAEKCPNIIRYYHAWVEKTWTYMVMEYCETSLAKQYEAHRKMQKPLLEGQIIRIAKEAMNALKYLHENNMVHLDLKPDNLLYSDQTLKVADLGLCRLARVKRWMELDEGDSRYLARQILNYNSETDLTKADIFSLGLTLYEGMSLVQLPNNGPFWHELRDGYTLTDKAELLATYQPRLLAVQIDVTQLVESMIAQNPANRPSARQILTQLRELEKTEKKYRMFKNSPKLNTPRERSL